MASSDWRRSLVLKHGLLRTLVGILVAASACAQETQQYGGVRSGKWAVRAQPATVETYRGKDCLAVSTPAGLVLKELEFESGTIEMDMALSQQGGFLGVDFRIEPDGKRFERIYFRPQASATPHAIQYDPHFNGYSNWQTYHGPLYEGNTPLPGDAGWFHVKIEVVGSQARVFVDDAQEPQLVVRELMSGSSAGAVGLWGTGAFFADIAIRRSDDSSATQPAATPGAPGQAFTLAPGTIAQWGVSQPFVIPADMGDEAQRTDSIRRRMEEADYANWGEVQPEDERGLVNLNRLVIDRPGGNATVLAGVVILADESQRRQLSFDSAEGVVVFLNGQSLYAGNDIKDQPAWRVASDDHSVELPLEKGRNELVLAVSSQRYGWAFLGRLSDPGSLVTKPLIGVE